ncbi:hypothetical protein DA090_13580 [Photobacterium damselae]|uniref:hypothetical protein n=1 Tax=Photobacterium damselae TaxID=38293 RepID=UPI001110B2E5|nr:hypothetical protein [Photobacterium damselae]TMX64810.1 hypothetical protein DA090_13580 [Photobacterium damselae]
MRLNLINKTFLPMFGEDDDNNENTITLTQAELNAKISEAVAGLKDNRDTILGEKKDLQSKLDSAIQKAEKYTKFFSQVEQDKEFASALEGGETSLRALMQNRVQARDAEWKGKMDPYITENESLKKQLADKDAEIVRNKASGIILSEATKNKSLQPTARQDAVDLIVKDAVFNKAGQLQFVDSEGNVRLGKDGNSLSIAERIDELLEVKDYMRIAMHGSGSGGSKSVPGSITMTKKDYRDKLILASDKEAKELQDKKASGAITLV